MKIRPATGFMTIDESMEHVREIADWAALIAFLEKHWVAYRPSSVVTVEKYGSFDKRIDWDTHLVCVDGKACLFSDGPMSKPKPECPNCGGDLGHPPFDLCWGEV